MTTPTNQMKNVYLKLANNGYKKHFVRSLLPEWWDDEIANTDSGLQQVSLILGRILGVRPESLWVESAALELSIPKDRKFKHRADTLKGSLDVACAISNAIAKIVVSGYLPTFKKDQLVDAAELRNRILDKDSWVTLQKLLDYCNDVGIPIIHLSYFPSGCKKMAGLAFQLAGRPVIVLTETKKHGYMLFDLAHELGHVTLNHVSKETWVIDERIEEDSDDEYEKAANRFALELLTGTPDCRIVPSGRNLSGQELATAASRFGHQHKVDPMHVALNYAHNTKHWPVAQIALSLLASNQPTDQELLRRNLFNNIDHDCIGEDDLAVVQKYCGN